MAGTKKSAAKRSSAKKSSSAKKKSPARKKSTRKSSGPLVEVARKIGTTLGEVNVAVRNQISKFSGGEPSDEE